MEDNKSDIELIIDLISGKKNISDNSSDYHDFKIEKTFKEKFSTRYEVSINGKNYIVYNPPLIISNPNSKESISIYNDLELSMILNELQNSDYYIKMNDENNTVYSLKNSRDLFINDCNFGQSYELIEKKENAKVSSFEEFLNIFNSKKNFPQSCKYYKLYCKNDEGDSFKFVQSSERSKFMLKITDFFLNNKNVIYFTGQRGIGKTTSILYRLYKSNIPFFYINIKYFDTSKNDLEKIQIIDFEKNNLFRPVNKTLYLEQNNKFQKDYGNQLYTLSDKLNQFIYVDNDNINKIDYVCLIIKIIILVNRKLNKAKQIEERQKIVKDMEKEIKLIIDKIKTLKIMKEVIEEKFYDFEFLVENKNLYALLQVLIKYKSYLSYLSYCKDIPEYTSKNIWDFVELLLKECHKLKLEFVLVLDQYKNYFTESEKLNKIIERFSTSKIIVCSSIDDYRIRSAVVNGNPNDIKFQDKIISLDDIKKEYEDAFKNLSDKKNKAINLFQNNTRETFDCLNEKDENLSNYINKKTKKIKCYFMTFCGENFSRISALIFIFNNIDCYWNEQDYKEIRNLIPFKYFTFEKIHKSSGIFKANNYVLGSYKEENIKNEKKEEQEKIISKYGSDENAFYYKINYSMKIVEYGLYEFIKEQDSLLFFEQYMQMSEKGSGKGIKFEEHVKSKISKGKIIPIEGLKIDETIDIWSLFGNPSDPDVPCLFEGKLENDKVYFLDLRNQKEPMFDCAIIDLIKKEILFIQITMNKKISHDVFSRKKIKKKSKEAIEFLTGKIIDENIKLKIGFFFIFLKYIMNDNNEQEYMNDSSKKLLYNMTLINEHLEKMIKKCKEQNLKYCLYKLPSVLSNHNKEPNYEFTQIRQEDKELYIFESDIKSIQKESEINNEESEDDEEENNEDNNHHNNGGNNEDNNDDKKEHNIKNNNEENKEVNSFKKKRNYMNMMFDSISLEKININDNLYIQEFYNFYSKKFKIENPLIYSDKSLYNFEKFQVVCKELHCFGIINDNKKDDNFIIIFYEDELCAFDIHENKKIEFDKSFENMDYKIYFLETEELIKSTLIKIQSKNKNLAITLKN